MSEPERPTCATCPYFQVKGPILGECHYSAPHTVSEEKEAAWWPQVENIDWCGQHPGFQAYLAKLAGGAVYYYDQGMAVTPGKDT